MAREPEVENLDSPVVRQEEIFGLEIPMDDSFLVCRAEAMRDLDRPLDDFTDRKRTVSKPGSQRLALEQFRDGVREAICRPEIEDSDD